MSGYFADLRHFVATREPLLLDEDFEALDGPVEGVEEEHGQGGQLSRPVPAVTAVDDDRRLLALHALCDADGAS